MQAMTMEQMENERRARLATAWTMFAASLMENEAPAPKLAVVGDGRVAHRRGGYGPVAA